VSKLFDLALKRAHLPSKLGAVGALAVSAIRLIAAAQADDAGKNQRNACTESHSRSSLGFE
jgi:hypothetical protein